MTSAIDKKIEELGEEAQSAFDTNDFRREWICDNIIAVLEELKPQIEAEKKALLESIKAEIETTIHKKCIHYNGYFQMEKGSIISTVNYVIDKHLE